jgi:hypothetical protein
MAVTPGEAAKINDAAERKAVDDIEATIDGLLNADYRTGLSVTVDDKTIRDAGGKGYTDRAWTEVKKRFQNVGWQIRKKSNPDRFGGGYPFHVFTAKNQCEDGHINCLHELR